MFYWTDRSDFAPPVAIIGLVALALLVISFVVAYARTGLWRFVHTNVKKLDERQMLVSYESLRHSYGLFAVTCLLVFLLSELIVHEFGGGFKLALMPIITALIYLAHVLPASIIAWTEREIYRE
jgi:hypothetical protein